MVSDKPLKVSILKEKELDLTKTQLKELLTTDNTKKIKRGKLVYETPIHKQKKKDLEAEIDKADSIDKLKTIISKLI